MLDNFDLLTNNTTVASSIVQQNNNLTYYFVPIYAILFFLGTFGNGLVIISIRRSSRLRTVTNTYLLNIAIADFVLLMSVPFLIVTILANGWIFGNILCKMYYNFIHINQYVSSLLLAALSFDRYLAVCHPVRAIEFRTRTKCVIIISVCWLISILFLCPTWVFATVISEQYVVWFGHRVQKCVIDFPAIVFRIPPEIVFTYYGFLLGFLIPVSMITTFYILVLRRLNNIRRKHKSGIKQRSHRKVTRIVLAVVTAYFICWVPYWFLQIFITIDPLRHSLRLNSSVLPTHSSMRFLKELTHLTTIFGYANNCLNPVLYVFLSDSFREEYLILLKCFNPGGLFIENTLHNGNVQKHSYKRELDRQQSFQRTNRQELAIKNIKHSVATEEVPSSYGSFSFFLHRGNNHRRPSHSSTSLRVNEHNRRRSENTITSSKNALLQCPNNNQKQMLMVNLSVTFTHPQSRITDDGGVYCGD
ncbi:unnamed protein product [Rotaria sordida]|uniref:G-protein coupled receptors family 1 profile domain-containing protein n=1 Tax=Rotaria sordida TaxID=392033 RepID=A0A814DGZ1_9BILA|nr:unnamed protein product [Rotaria sordida]CAF3843518.1 unnamed protein product [Rotaria sordida]